MQKMKEEANRFKELELKRAREIAQLRKESRKRENEIRTLQMDKRVKETVLKRKQEEVNALRKNQARHGALSDLAAGRVVPGAPRCLSYFCRADVFLQLASAVGRLGSQVGTLANRTSRSPRRWPSRNGRD